MTEKPLPRGITWRLGQLVAPELCEPFRGLVFAQALGRARAEPIEQRGERLDMDVRPVLHRFMRAWAAASCASSSASAAAS